MAKVDVQGIKGRKQIYHAVYDFSKDGGVKDTAIEMFGLAANTIIHDAWFEVETAIEGTSSTIEMGLTGGDTDGIFAQIAEATCVADYVSDDQAKGALLFDDTNDHNIRKKFTAADTLDFLIGTANLTAGKAHFYIECSAGY